MSNHPHEPATGRKYDAPELTGVAESNQGNSRPSLRIRIPGGLLSGEEFPVLQIDQMPEDRALLNIRARIPVSQQGSQISQQNSAEIKDQQPNADALGTGVLLADTVGQEQGPQEHDPTQLEEESPAPGLFTADKTSPTVVIHVAGSPWHSGYQTVTSSSSHFNDQFTAGQEIYTSQGRLGGSATVGELSSAEEVASPSSYPFLAKTAVQGDDPRQGGEAQLMVGPRGFGRRHGHETNNNRGPPRRLHLQQQREATHTNSRTWIHPRTREQTKWAEVHKNLKEMSLIIEGPQSPYTPLAVDRESFCVPKNLNEWIDHRKEYANDRMREARQRLYAMQEHKLIPRHPDLPPAGETAPVTMPPFGGKKFNDGRSAVLALPTVWTPWNSSVGVDQNSPGGGRTQALWPCSEEMREEGNERNTSQFGRFMALPRTPGNPTVNWKQKKILPMLPFDEIWKLPSRETYYDQRVVTSPEEKENMESMIGGDLLAALNCEVGED